MKLELALGSMTNCIGPDLGHPLDELTSKDPAKEAVVFEDRPGGVRKLDCRWLERREDGSARCTIFTADLPYAVRRTIKEVRQSGVKGQKAFNQLTQALDGLDGLVKRAERDYNCRLARRDI